MTGRLLAKSRLLARNKLRLAPHSGGIAKHGAEAAAAWNGSAEFRHVAIRRVPDSTSLERRPLSRCEENIGFDSNFVRHWLAGLRIAMNDTCSKSG